MPSGPDVLVRRQGRAGRITLNRPAVLNALDAGMIGQVAAALSAWRDDPAIHLVVIDSASDRAFCAGGDIRAVRDWALAGNRDAIERYFVQEYGLNAAIAQFPVPYVALIDGICMGGGIGLSVHGRHRVVTERASFAMPETQIGLFPDVGGSFILPRLRGSLGLYLALTGLRVGAADACFLGLATNHVSPSAMTGLGDALAEQGLSALTVASQTPPAAPLAERAAEIDAIFSQPSLTAIISSLEASSAAWAGDALAAMRTASPASLRWTFALMQEGAHRTLAECQSAELAMTRIATAHPDFAEGVRAMVIEKDRKPRWAAEPAA